MLIVISLSIALLQSFRVTVIRESEFGRFIFQVSDVVLVHSEAVLDPAQLPARFVNLLGCQIYTAQKEKVGKVIPPPTRGRASPTHPPTLPHPPYLSGDTLQADVVPTPSPPLSQASSQALFKQLSPPPLSHTSNLDFPTPPLAQLQIYTCCPKTTQMVSLSLKCRLSENMPYFSPSPSPLPPPRGGPLRCTQVLHLSDRDRTDQRPVVH